ncbi:MAG: hypothetical protein ACSHX9_10820 [Luteolibacter sp.]
MRLLLGSVIPILLAVLPLPAATLYVTDFEEFTAGINKWSATGGWMSNDNVSGAQSIDQDLIPSGGLGRTASLGFRRPQGLFTFVAKSINHDVATTGLSRVQVNTLMGIEDSANGRRDDFYLSIYNAAGNRLASIRFDNQSPFAPNSQFGIWREDGVNQFDTLLDFISGELFNLLVTIDITANTWSADIGGIPLFENVPFTATSHARNFGLLAFEWRVSGASTDTFGDNYLLVADVSVRSLPNGATPIVSTISRDSSGNTVISWQADAGNNYQVQRSPDLVNWFDDLPSSSFPSFTSTMQKSYTDATSPKPLKRFYRVRRTESN